VPEKIHYEYGVRLYGSSLVYREYSPAEPENGSKRGETISPETFAQILTAEHCDVMAFDAIGFYTPLLGWISPKGNAVVS
jgi:hypothetical protein